MERRVTFELELPFLLRLEDREFRCRGPNGQFAVRTTLVAPSVGTNEVRSAGFRVMPNTGEVVADSPHQVTPPGVSPSHTRLAVAFIMQVGSREQEWLPLAQEEARKCINFFLEAYRFVQGDPRVHPLVPGEFFAVRHGRAVRFKSEVLTNEPAKALEMGVTFGGFPLTIQLGEQPLLDSGRLLHFVQEGIDVPLLESSILNALMYLERGDYRFAVVEAGTALDIAVEGCAHRLLVGQGLDPAAATSRLEPLSTKQIVTTVIKPNSSPDITASSDWQRYDSTLRPLRNAVIHDGLVPGKKDAEVFISTVRALTSLLA